MNNVKSSDKLGSFINMHMKRLMVAGIPLKNEPSRLLPTHNSV